MFSTCRRLGVQIYEGCDIKKVLVNDKGRVYGVDTDEGFQFWKTNKDPHFKVSWKQVFSLTAVEL